MKGYHISSGLLKRAYKPISKATAITIKYVNGVELHIPKEDMTRTGQLKAGVAKAVLLKDYTKLSEKYGVIVKSAKKGA